MTHQYANNPITALSGAVTAGSTSISVASATGFPTQGKFTIIVDSEIMLVTGVAGLTWTVTRGHDGTAAAAHNNNAAVTQILTVDSFLNSQHYDVRAYGAKGNGVTDDSAAINAALSAASAAGGGTVYLPPGNYILGTSVAPGSNTVLRGAGPASKLTCTANTPAISVNSASNVQVRDLQVVGGNNGAFTSNRGVHFNTVTAGLISNVRTLTCYQGISVYSSSSITVENCYVANDISGGSDAGIRLSSTNRCTVRGNFIDTPAAHGINAGSLGTDSIIEGNHIWSPGNAGITINGSSTTGTGPGILIANNIIRDAAVNGMIIENGASWIRCIGNFVYTSASDGISISDGTGDAPAHVIIADNVIRTAGRYGIFDNGCNYITIEGNTVTVFVDDGIRCGAGIGCKVTGNTVTDGSSTLGAGIRIYSGLNDAIVANNTIRANAGIGIVIDADRAIVTGNAVRDNDVTGVLAVGGIVLTGNASRTTVTGNVSRRNSGTRQDYGVEIRAGCTNAVIVGNILFENTTAATLDGGTGTVLANNITT